jgi:hypothetical protein
MDSPFQIKLAEICAQATGSEESKKAVLAKCASFELSPREDFLLGAVFSPSTEDVQAFLDLYSVYLPYIRGVVKKMPDIQDWKEANKIDLSALDLESVDVFGWLLRQTFLWNGDSRYEAVIREVVRKLEAYTNGAFEFDGLTENWSKVYYRLMVVMIAENLAFLEKPIQMFFVGSKMFVDALILGIDLDDKINNSVDYYVYLSLRFDQSTDTATFLYANEQPVGSNPETGEPTKLAFWVDKFRVYSNKKFDGLSLINFIQDEKTWGEYNDGLVRTIIKNILMIYGHLVSGYYIYPSMGELEQYNKTNKSVNTEVAPASVSVPQPAPAPAAPVTSVPIKSAPPSYAGTRDMVLSRITKFSEEDKPAAIIDLLGELSKKYDDPTIADLYYFDEESGEFKWRE